MPHIVFEYSNNLDSDIKSSDALKLAHKTVVDSGLFNPEAVKARAISYNDYVLPEGASNFLHITISILTGRDMSERKSLSNTIFETIKTAIPAVEKLSVNIHEMEADSYSK